MLEYVNIARPYFEILYFAAGIALAAGLGLTYWQLTLIKKDMRLRSERAAMEKAIDTCERHLSVFIPLSLKSSMTFEANKLPSFYDGTAGNFMKNSIPKELNEISLKRYSCSFDWVAALNQLESIAATFMSGVADEQTAFRIIGRTYCSSVESYYDLIAISRPESITAHQYWSNTVELYLLWRPRLTKAELENTKLQAEEKILKLGNRCLAPHGVDN